MKSPVRAKLRRSTSQRAEEQEFPDVGRISPFHNSFCKQVAGDSQSVLTFIPLLKRQTPCDRMPTSLFLNVTLAAPSHKYLISRVHVSLTASLTSTRFKQNLEH